MRDRKGVLSMAKKRRKRQKEPLDEPFLLSPQFDNQGGWGKKFSGWWQKYFKSVILPAIIVILIAGGIYAYTSRQESLPQVEDLTASLDQNQPQIEIQENKIEDLERETTSETLSLGETDEGGLIISPQTQTIQQKAAKGEGVTHLARRALKEYLENVRPELNLLPEQKIYCEDFIQNRTANRPLEIGEELSFEIELIEAAIEATQNLTESQIQNLSKYVPLVPSL